jgi:hypothetical protein
MMLVARDLISGEQLWELAVADWPKVLASGDGKVLAVQVPDSRGVYACLLVEAATGRQMREVKVPWTLQTLTGKGFRGISGDGKVGAVVYDSERPVAVFFDLEKDEELGRREMETNDHPVLNGDGSLALLRGADGAMEVVATRGGRCVGRLEGSDWLMQGTFAGDGRIFTMDRKRMCDWGKLGPADFAKTILPVRLGFK